MSAEHDSSQPRRVPALGRAGCWSLIKSGVAAGHGDYDAQMAQGTSKNGRGTVFPIVEAFGYAHDSDSPSAAKAREEKTCPFADGLCEKYRQYGYGYCSVTYSADWNKGEQVTYAVCDHRLDGSPVEWAVGDYFPDQRATLVPEVQATSKPAKLNIDYVAFCDDPAYPDDTRIIAIETQAIDLRGGGVGPAWKAWEEDDVANWRQYFTEEANLKGRKDTVDYGVNTSNVSKRLGTQVATKGEYLKNIDVPLYVIMQQSVLKQLRARIDFAPVEEGEPWDITFAGFDYGRQSDSEGMFPLELVEVARTTLANYLQAMTSSTVGTASRSDFVEKARKKAKTVPSQNGLF
ncbi:hypothetical protein [Streptomyces sp. NPDC055099]